MPNQHFRSIVSILVLGAAVLAGAGWLLLPQTAASAQAEGEETLEIPENDDPTLILKGVKATISQAGQLSNKIEAERAELTMALTADQSIMNLEESKKTLDLADLHITFYENGELFAGGIAQSSKMWLDDHPEIGVERNDTVLEGDVDFTVAGGLRFQTQQIRYSQQQVRLWSETPVRMYKRGGGGSDIVSQGTGFMVELIPGTTEVKTFQLFGNEQERGTIRAVRAEELETQP